MNRHPALLRFPGRRSDALTLTEFRNSVESAWSMETTFCVESYRGADPAHGQCAVTSVLLQDHFGGELMRGHAVGAGRHVWHYWNRVDGLDIDLTWRQFPVGTVIRDPESTTREVLLANRWMRERYDNLRIAADLPEPGGGPAPTPPMASDGSPPLKRVV